MSHRAGQLGPSGGVSPAPIAAGWSSKLASQTQGGARLEAEQEGRKTIPPLYQNCPEGGAGQAGDRTFGFPPEARGSLCRLLPSLAWPGSRCGPRTPWKGGLWVLPCRSGERASEVKASKLRRAQHRVSLTGEPRSSGAPVRPRGPPGAVLTSSMKASNSEVAPTVPDAQLRSTP